MLYSFLSTKLKAHRRDPTLQHYSNTQLGSGGLTLVLIVYRYVFFFFLSQDYVKW